MRRAIVVVVVCLAGAGCMADGTTEDETGSGSEALSTCLSQMRIEDCITALPPLGGCFVTGIGHIGDEANHPGAGRAGEDSFGGNAMGMRDGSVRGEWQNTTHQGDLFHGQATWLRCWKDEGEGPEVPRAIPNVAEWGGPGKWNHDEGFTFQVHAEDRREGGSHFDYYGITVWDAAGAVIYEEGDLIDGGNFQIHPPNGGHPYEPVPAP